LITNVFLLQTGLLLSDQLIPV